jgi:hypothetical protein
MSNEGQESVVRLTFSLDFGRPTAPGPSSPGTGPGQPSLNLAALPESSLALVATLGSPTAEALPAGAEAGSAEFASLVLGLQNPSNLTVLTTGSYTDVSAAALVAALITLVQEPGTLGQVASEGLASAWQLVAEVSAEPLPGTASALRSALEVMGWRDLPWQHLLPNLGNLFGPPSRPRAPSSSRAVPVRPDSTEISTASPIAETGEAALPRLSVPGALPENGEAEQTVRLTDALAVALFAAGVWQPWWTDRLTRDKDKKETTEDTEHTE